MRLGSLFMLSLLLRSVVASTAASNSARRNFAQASIINNMKHSTDTTQSSDEETKQEEVLALPWSEPQQDESGNRVLNVGGPAITLDEMGPVIVNKDGTLSRIHNWSQMTAIERATTLRRIGARNKERLDAIKAEQAVLELQEAAVHASTDK